MRECACTEKEAIRRLKKWGYIDPGEYSAVTFKRASIRRALKHFQEFNGLEPDGKFGPRSARQFMHPHRCGLPDIMPIMRDGMCLWPQKDIKYYAGAMFLQGVPFRVRAPHLGRWRFAVLWSRVRSKGFVGHGGRSGP